jgi:hypothetical protein
VKGMYRAAYSTLNLPVQRTELSGDFGQRTAKTPEPFGVKRGRSPWSAGDRTETRPNPVTEEVDATKFSSENVERSRQSACSVGLRTVWERYKVFVLDRCSGS